MKNFRLFETEAEHNEAVIEECSVSYVVESNKLYTTPENNGEITFKILVEGEYRENDEPVTIIDTLTLKAVKSMTWSEFIDSTYNTLNFRYEFDEIYFSRYDENNDCNYVHILRYNNDYGIGLSDIIIPNHEYSGLMGGE